MEKVNRLSVFLFCFESGRKRSESLLFKTYLNPTSVILIVDWSYEDENLHKTSDANLMFLLMLTLAHPVSLKSCK